MCIFYVTHCNCEQQMAIYNDVMMSTMASQITSLTIVYSTIYSGTDEIKHQSSASLAFVRGIHRWPVNSPHKGPVTRKMFPFDDVIIVNVFTILHDHFRCTHERKNSMKDMLYQLQVIFLLCVLDKWGIYTVFLQLVQSIAIYFSIKVA